MKRFKYETSYFVILFLGLLALVGLMIWDYLTSIIFAGILAGAFYPVMRFAVDRWKLNRTLAAALVCVVILLLVFLPAVYIAARLTQETAFVINRLQSPETEKLIKDTFFGSGYATQLSKEIFESIFAGKQYSIESIQSMLVDLGKTISGKVLSQVNAVLGNVFSFLWQFLLMMIMIFAFFKEGPRLKDFLLWLSPLPDEDEELILKKFNEMNFVTLVGNGVGGVIQGVLAGIGFAFAGIGSTLLWTVLMIVLAFIPLVGISIVYVPACLYLLATGNWVASIVLFVYCTGISLVVENWFKPLFMGTRVRMNSLLVFFSIIGGMSAFGMAGIFYGPLIITIFLTFVSLYEEKYLNRLSEEVEGTAYVPTPVAELEEAAAAEPATEVDSEGRGPDSES